MRTFRLIILAALFAVVLVGCITFADSYSDQNPRNVTVSQAATALPTPEPMPDLTAPTLSASQTGAEEATISWTAVDGATGYQLERRDSGKPWAPIGDVVTQTDRTTILELTIAVTYDFRVRAVAGNGSEYAAGPWSDVVSITLAEPTPTPGPTPTPAPTPTYDPDPDDEN